ncbi:hypothetical protein CANARDRAFT_23817 [[Candida] arabinofermentans NRRL YB-2248]|uniref:Actin cortical patch SUR7/pH-response regulator pali n=1 Tax=[Candida] arabinofermentans NRRL YB-2248 TaxID=983967 RepID=A0A1E4SZ89_9ASCO|nr:hypothetical protein CANARDRAFT_23817 [[Candida] arabinofermentans NRRL YB-2248]
MTWIKPIISLLTLASFAFFLVCNVGTITKSSTINPTIYLLRLDMEGTSLDEIFTNSTASEFGNVFLPEYITVGMYGYCYEYYDSSTTNAHCTTPKPMYVFNPKEIIADELNEFLDVSTIEPDLILIPDKIEKYISIASTLSKLIYITSCISIIMTFISFILSFFKRVSNIMIFLQVICFISSLLASGVSTGMYQYITKQFNDKYSEFGIKAYMSTNYLVLTWFGTVLCLVVIILWFIYKRMERQQNVVKYYEHEMTPFVATAL